ncbi:hypothetical protein VHEMI08894 [[Torrubiella] hemipterigena]|uniref:Uncharacterized protein n=1 Tax=[Torrubiella] hemipterigena TaxID=1531966 RepID=A0A0A1TP19_9HYPO|nr:hypothetical protein VHEMI08894 [[Torrubiella] hemipterigena]
MMAQGSSSWWTTTSSRHASRSSASSSSSSSLKPKSAKSLLTSALQKPTTTTTPSPASTAAVAAALPRQKTAFKYAADDAPDATFTVTVSPVKPPSTSRTSFSTSSDDSDDAASMSKGRSGSRRLAPSSPPSSTTVLTRSSTPTSSPVQIPRQQGRDGSHSLSRHSSTHHRKPSKKSHRQHAISPSVAALLAVTDIPRPRQASKRSRQAALTVNDIIDQQVSEKELSWNMNKSPLDVLLTPPEDLHGDDYLSASESNIGSALTETISIDSTPSLADSFATEGIPSLDTPPQRARRALSPVRKSLEPIRSPPDSAEEQHPLAVDDADMDDYESSVTSDLMEETAMSLLSEQFRPLKAVFKSNLTASLRALRSAAKSFSSINFAVAPDDLITRSILTMDPKVPYADERRPPVMEDIPSAELRRYLNPTMRNKVEEASPAAMASTTVQQPRPAAPPSIQMQTYKIHRFNKPTSRSLPNTAPQATPPPPSRATSELAVPGMRQREMRENPDFIRIAVMEMAMRRNGKLDDKRPGRARWALPPRKAAAREYQVGDDGVPARWIPATNA